MTSASDSRRRGRSARAVAAATLLAVVGLVRSTPGADPADSAALSAYRERLAPLLATRCCPCHGALAQEAGLRLDTAAAILAGGESGPAVVPGDPAASLLVRRVCASDVATRMPPEGEGEPLDERQIATLRDWIAAGAPAPPDERPAADPRDHWAFRPRVRPQLPADGAGWARNPIDRFVARAHAARGLTPRPEAPRHVLVRRAYLDLVGLPPTDAEAAAVAADAAPDWYERLVDRLLADPRHGERWARHWMDVWRYSDWWGLGDDHRNSQKHIWHWRDWIVESLAADVPYDEMVRQMLAADELYPEDAARLRATGYLARSFFKWNRDQWLEETVEHVAKGFLGLTMNCTKCHDHKYDPIRQEDFYRMRAFFEPYHCRLDVVPGVPDLAVDGIPRVFDALPDAPTYLFVRGDAARADTSRSIAPGVPAVFDFAAPAIEPVPLPPAAWQPARRPELMAAARAAAERDVAAAERDLAAARATLAVAAARAAGGAPPPPAPAAPAEPPICVEDFAAFRPDRWQRIGGTWRHEPGRITQDLDGPVWSALELTPAPPRDFDLTIRFVLRGGSQFRSVGVVFDTDRGADQGRPMGTAQLVYCSGHAPGPKVQGAFRDAGPWQFPAAGARAIPFGPGTPHVLRIAARDTLVNAWLDDRLVLAWRSPLARRDGALQLVTFDALATFEHVSLAALAADARLADPGAGDAATAPADAAAVAEAEVAARVAAHDAALAARTAVERRIDAARAGWAAADAAGTPDGGRLEAAAAEGAGAAARAEREGAAAAARAQVAGLRLELARAPVAGRAAVQQKIEQAQGAVTRAEQALATAGTAFTPFVGAAWSATRFKTTERDDPAPPFPRTSTGRRRALAAWITDPRHPLTARVAVNHVWLRHMGQPLVATVFDFGHQGNLPDHPELLDWLASELVDGPGGGPTWSLRHLHRLIVTSATYRMSSSSAGAGAAERSDPDNRFLWRREPIRLEAEVIRDALLAIAGRLDPARGGPPVPPGAQADSRRRSLYLFHSSVDRSPFLTTFDGADVQDCYRREQSVVPQQALALANAALVHESAAAVAERLAGTADDEAFVEAAFRTVLGRGPTPEEVAACGTSLAAWRAEAGGNGADPARRHLVWALFNHNDFVVLR